MVDFPPLLQDLPGITGRPSPSRAAQFPDPNFWLRIPRFPPIISQPGGGVETSPEIRGPQAEFMGRLSLWWDGHHFPRISRKSRAVRRQLMGPSHRTLIAEADSSQQAHFQSHRRRIGNDVGNKEFLAAISVRNEGRLGRRWIGWAAISPGSPGNHGPSVAN